MTMIDIIKPSPEKLTVVLKRAESGVEISKILLDETEIPVMGHIKIRINNNLEQVFPYYGTPQPYYIQGYIDMHASIKYRPDSIDVRFEE